MKKIMKSSLLIGIALFLASSCEKENTLKKVDDVCTKMEDSNFMKYCYDNFDVNKDGMVSMQEAAAVKRISFSSSSTTSLKGIEYFTTITYLYCECILTSLDVSKNTQLTELYCFDNNLTSLDVSKNTRLTKLYCDYNNLTSLDVSKNTQLTLLGCQNNNLTSLDVSKNTQLTYLSCSDNNLTSLDVSKNLSIRSDGLACKQNCPITVFYSANQPIEEWKSEYYYSSNITWILK